MQNYYDILNIKFDSTQDEIKRNYRKLSLKYYPDLNKNDEDIIKKYYDIESAFKVLGNEENRKKYNIKLYSLLNNSNNSNDYKDFFKLENYQNKNKLEIRELQNKEMQNNIFENQELENIVEDTSNETEISFSQEAVASTETDSNNSNDLKEFGVDTEEPDLFSDKSETSSEDLLGTSENDEDDLEIPAFLRRQKN